MSIFTRDAIERIGFTALEAGAAYVITLLADVPAWWAVPLATVIAGLKSAIAKKIGNPDSASVSEYI